MKTSNTISSRNINILLIVVIIILTVTATSFAQSWQRATHIGVESSLGINGFSPMLLKGGDVRAMSRGIATGFVIGNNLLKARIRAAGLYVPTKFSKSTGHIFESEALVNIYPLEFLRTRKNVLDIYFTAGFKFANTSIENKPVQLKNDAVLVSSGKGNVISQVAGIGCDYLLPSSNKFVHLFAEVLFSNPFYTSRSSEFFSNAWTLKTSSLNVGVRFGAQRVKKR